MSEEHQIVSAEDVAKDYSFEEFIAEIAGVSVEYLRQKHLQVCELIGRGVSSLAAIEQLCEGEDNERQ